MVVVRILPIGILISIRSKHFIKQRLARILRVIERQVFILNLNPILGIYLIKSRTSGCVIKHVLKTQTNAKSWIKLPIVILSLDLLKDLLAVD